MLWLRERLCKWFDLVPWEYHEEKCREAFISTLRIQLSTHREVQGRPVMIVITAQAAMDINFTKVYSHLSHDGWFARELANGITRELAESGLVQNA